jgi:hypothetical protein
MLVVDWGYDTSLLIHPTPPKMLRQAPKDVQEKIRNTRRFYFEMKRCRQSQIQELFETSDACRAARSIKT